MWTLSTEGSQRLQRLRYSRMPQESQTMCQPRKGVPQLLSVVRQVRKEFFFPAHRLVVESRLSWRARFEFSRATRREASKVRVATRAPASDPAIGLLRTAAFCRNYLGVQWQQWYVRRCDTTANVKERNFSDAAKQHPFGSATSLYRQCLGQERSKEEDKPASNWNLFCCCS